MDVLLIEDDGHVRDVLTALLDEAGLRATDLPDGEGLLAPDPEVEAPGVVITDVDLGHGCRNGPGSVGSAGQGPLR